MTADAVTTPGGLLLPLAVLVPFLGMIAGLVLGGVDGGLVKAHRRAPVTLAGGEVVDYGMVGDIDGVDGTVITRLLDAGVRIHEMEHALMHAKTAVIDGVFSTVGSSNLDWRSLVDNHELNVIVLGDDFGRQMAAMFERDRDASLAIDTATWSQRPWSRRALEQAGRMAERWL